MIGKINLWAQGIIIAVILSTVLQMIIPENKNKKYIKIVMGIYVLFCMINPVVGNSFNIREYNFENYILLNETSNNNLQTYDENVKQLFIDKVKMTIKNQLNSYGYDSSDIQIDTDENYNIKSIHVSNITEYRNESFLVNKIEIGIKDKIATGMPTSKKIEFKEYLKNTLKVEEENIYIN